MGAYYIVSDLVLRARFEPAQLHAELLAAGLHGRVDLYNGVYTAGYSSSERCCRVPAECLPHLLDIIEKLGPEAKQEWNACASRKFDMGFECFDERFASRWRIKGPLLRRLADVNGDLVVTIYRRDESRALEETEAVTVKTDFF